MTVSWAGDQIVVSSRVELDLRFELRVEHGDDDVFVDQGSAPNGAR
ncbi:MAG: hypothetical protein ABMB14_33490 [Myxococcota bacterium]